MVSDESKHMDVNVRDDRSALTAGAAEPTCGLRFVNRAIAELRRGAAVRLQEGAANLLVLAAETTGPSGIAEFVAGSMEPPRLLLEPTRAAGLGLCAAVPAPEALPVALWLPATFDVRLLRELADPTVTAPGRVSAQPAPLPHGASAAVLLAKLARLLPAVLVATSDPFATPDLLSVTAEQVLGYGDHTVASLRKVAEAAMPLEDAEDARLVAFRPADGGIEHLALLIGDPAALVAAGGAPLARLHSECFTGDLLGSLRCDCGPQLRGAVRRMAAEGAGVLLYLAQEGRGIGLPNKLRAYALQCQGLDTLDANRALGWGADERDFRVAGVMLRELGIERVRLLTNNPAKLAALSINGIDVVGRVPHTFPPNGLNDRYLATKADRFGHLLAS